MLSRLRVEPEGLFWSAPLSSEGDFALEDPLALDYLGQQVGLWLFPGFTTRTSRAQYYPVVLYGLHLADLAVREYGYPGDDKVRTGLFERWERFWSLGTMEYRSGELDQSDDDNMRGVRGAKRAWRPGTAPLPLDFQLISRQNELGALGAYLSSLRTYGLAFPGTLRVTPAAREIISAFWGDPAKHSRTGGFEEYALLALDLDRETTSRKHGSITLGHVGRRTRLSSIRRRPDQQERLWQALFIQARDESTHALSEALIRAASEEMDYETLLSRMRRGRFGQLPERVTQRVDAAFAFGRAAQELLDRFDRAYEYVDGHGWVVDYEEAAAAAFPPARSATLSEVCSNVLTAPYSAKFRELGFHGRPFLTLLSELREGPPPAQLERLLWYHRDVHKSRRGGGAWLRRESDKLTMQLAGYNGYKSEPQFPTLKLDAIQRLLRDLGRID